MTEGQDANPFLKGSLSMLLLAALAEAPRHGYSILRWLEQASSERLRIEEGALYPALHRLEERGWIESTWGLSEKNRRARYYRLLPSGRRQLERARRQWRQHVETVKRVLAAPSGGGS